MPASKETTTKAKQPSKVQTIKKQKEELLIDPKFISLSGQGDSAKAQLADAIVKIEMENAKARTIKKLKEADDVYWMTDKDQITLSEDNSFLLISVAVIMFSVGVIWTLKEARKGNIRFSDY